MRMQSPQSIEPNSTKRNFFCAAARSRASSRLGAQSALPGLRTGSCEGA